MTNINVECCFCHKFFQKEKGLYNWAIKQKWKSFCSKECRIKYKTKSKNLKCFNCGKDIIVGNCDYKRSKTKKFFCCNSCAAVVNNKNRIFSDEKRKKISEKTRNSIRKYLKTQNKIMLEKKTCFVCNKIFSPIRKSHKFCSKKCQQIYKFGSVQYTKDEIVNKIIELSKQLKRTPQKRDCLIRLTSAAVRFFGTWNKAMGFCGLKPNKSLFQKTRLKCQDGHMADSISEKIVDEWLFSNKINHERSKKYPNSNMDCDFYLPNYNIWLEYFGLIGHKKYEIGMELKRQIAKDNNLNFIEIIPSDLYPKNKLDSFLPRIKGGQEVVKQEGLFDGIKVLDVKMIGNAPIE